MASTTDTVRIHYHRPPDRDDVFVQRLLEQTADCIVTFMERTPLAVPIIVHDEIILEPGSPVLWFTFPDRWHDVGLFHTAAGRFTGTYANILTPVRFRDDRTWETTDLFLDVWQDSDGRTTLLDQDELANALWVGALERELADRARTEAAAVLASIRTGEWPPECVSRWNLARARAAVSS